MKQDRCGGHRSAKAIANGKAPLAIALITLLTLVLLFSTSNVFARDSNPKIHLDVPADAPLDRVLLNLANGANMFLFAGSLTGYKTPPVKGTLSMRQALDKLLGPSGLSYRIEGQVIYIVPREKATPKWAGPGDLNGLTTENKPRAGEREGEDDQKMHQVTVEGHHIPGSALSSPNIVLDRLYFERGGFQSVGDALRSLPQSFGGGFNVGVISAGGSLNTPSQSAASSANLRGLGSDSTLVLVNGQRLATSEGSGAVDVSIIPLSAVERIEIITGSASALYGSDAVAGVVNIILRTDFQGVEGSAALGTATEGGYFLHHYSVVAGHTSNTANLFAAGDCAWHHEIDSQQRDYIPSELTGTTLLPRTHHCSTLFSVQGFLPKDMEVSLLGTFTNRSVLQSEDFPLSGGLGATTQTDVNQYAVSGTFTGHLPRSWTVALTVGLSADDVSSPERLTHNGVAYANEGDRFDNRLWSGQLIASGTVLETRAGPLQLAVGAGYNQQSFDFANLPGGEFSVVQQRRIRFAFAESNIPLIQSRAGAKNSSALTFDVAVRAEQYSDVGGAFNPKAALVYQYASSVKVAASVGTSFRAPSLLQQYDLSQAVLEFISDPVSTSGQSLALLRFGGNPNLEPEESTDAALDLTFTPAAIPGGSLQIGYYNISYRKRIEYPTPKTTDPLSDQNVWPFVNRNPGSAYIEQILEQAQLVDRTAGQFATQQAGLVIDDRNQNISRQNASGVDLLTKYSRGTATGLWDFSLNVAYLELQQKITNTSVSDRLNGITFYPPTWRGRFGVSWTYSRYLTSVFVNYIGGSREVSQPDPIASWTTLDGQIGMILDGAGDAHRNKVRLTLSAQNMFDRHPPLIPLSQGLPDINYDSTNSSPVGRFLTLQLTRVW